MALLVLAACAAEVGDVEVAGTAAKEPELVAYLADLRQAAQLALQSAELRGRLGMAYDANGFFDAAAATYGQAAALDPADFAWPYLQATALAKYGDFTGAFAAMDRALALDGAYAGAWLLRGGWLLDIDEHADARASYEQAVTLAKDRATRAAALVGVARAMLRQEQPQDAVALLQELVASFPHPYVQQILSTAYLRVGKTDEARKLQTALAGTAQTKLEWLDEISARKAAYVRGFSGQLKIAERMLKDGQAQRALAILRDLRAQAPDVRSLPDGRRWLNILSFAYRLLDQNKQAELVMEQALETYPDFPLFHFTLAVLLEERGDHFGALKHLDQAIALSPSLLAAHERKIGLLLEAHRFEEALPVIDARLSYGNARPQTYFDAGLVAGALTRWPQAIGHFEQALALDPAFARAELFLGRSLAETGQFDQAETALAAAARLGTDPNDIAVAQQRLNDLRIKGTK